AHLARDSCSRDGKRGGGRCAGVGEPSQLQRARPVGRGTRDQIFVSGAAPGNVPPMIATVETLTDQARERTGLADFGPEGWRDGLERLVAAVQTDIGDDPDAVERIEAIILSRLVIRLRIEEWYADHGEEAADPVEGPLAIVGLPRTATTALNYLLAIDPQ